MRDQVNKQNTPQIIKVNLPKKKGQVSSGFKTFKSISSGPKDPEEF